MEITRDTMRADGKTVGQAMDEDAAFLSGVGINAKDGQPTFDEMRATLKDRVRDAVLDALDSASPSGKGWVDGDLTGLFKAIDHHSDNLFDRLSPQSYTNFITAIDEAIEMVSTSEGVENTDGKTAEDSPADRLAKFIEENPGEVEKILAEIEAKHGGKFTGPTIGEFLESGFGFNSSAQQTTEELKVAMDLLVRAEKLLCAENPGDIKKNGLCFDINAALSNTTKK